MPKKYHNRALLTKPSSSAPSTLSSSRTIATSHGGEQSKPTVNDLIKESRRNNGDFNQGFDVASLSSIHPSIRETLNMPSPAAPLPRTQLHNPGRLRRIPGPPPPQSWLAQSSHATDEQRLTFSKLRLIRARVQQQSSTLPGLLHLPRLDSLEHLIYVKVATRWQWHAGHDNTYMSMLPVVSRETLLSYVAIYHGLGTVNPFPLLFPPECDSHELEAVTRLDLTNAVGSWATVKRIEKELVLAREAHSQSGKSKQKMPEIIPESWDAADDNVVTSTIPVGIPSRLRFPHLKHLSLAFDPASCAEPPSWASLISLTSLLPGLTSLSLAHWPTPTYTPNAAQSRIKIIDSTRPSIPAPVFGGTDIYTAYDNNWREAAGILRSLSRNLYCLQWLDLAGCVPWLPALIWVDEHGEQMGADWNGSWRNLSTLHLAVGWLPGRPADSTEESLSARSTSSIDSARAIEQLYGGQHAIQESLEAIANIRLGVTLPRPLDETVEPTWNVEEERRKQNFRRDVSRFMEQQDSAQKVATQIKTIRKSSVGAKWIDFDFGTPIDEQMLKSDW